MAVHCQTLLLYCGKGSQQPSGSQSPLRHFICILYIPRKRIPGFSLLCVFVLLLHGPWCQLRLSIQWNYGVEKKHTDEFNNSANSCFLLKTTSSLVLKLTFPSCKAHKDWHCLHELAVQGHNSQNKRPMSRLQPHTLTSLTSNTGKLSLPEIEGKGISFNFNMSLSALS
jgi:hypothetical protein